MPSRKASRPSRSRRQSALHKTPVRSSRQGFCFARGSAAVPLGFPGGSASASTRTLHESPSAFSGSPLLSCAWRLPKCRTVSRETLSSPQIAPMDADRDTPSLLPLRKSAPSADDRLSFSINQQLPISPPAFPAYPPVFWHPAISDLPFLRRARWSVCCSSCDPPANPWRA